jgi:hypothetical protein
MVLPLRSSSLLDQELEVGVEVALGEQHVLRALPGHGGGGNEKIVGSGEQCGHQSGKLRRVDGDLALDDLGNLVRQIEVESLVATGETRHGMGRERAVDG